MKKLFFSILFLIGLSLSFSALSVDSFTCDANVEIGQPITCIATIKNTASQGSASISSVSLFIDGSWAEQSSYTGSGFSTTLSAGATTTATFSNMKAVSSGQNGFDYIKIGTLTDIKPADTKVNVVSIKILNATSSIEAISSGSEFTAYGIVTVGGKATVNLNISITSGACSLKSGEVSLKTIGSMADNLQGSKSWSIIQGADSCTYEIKATASSGSVTVDKTGTKTVSSLGVCKDGTLDAGEECDSDGDCSAGKSCSSSCKCIQVITSETSCSNNIDDNADGKTDCQDTTACPTNTYCGVGKACISGACVSVSTEVNCSDGLDNDADGLIDCLDSDCSSYSACVSSPSPSSSSSSTIRSIRIDNSNITLYNNETKTFEIVLVNTGNIALSNVNFSVSNITNFAGFTVQGTISTLYSGDSNIFTLTVFPDSTITGAKNATFSINSGTVYSTTKTVLVTIESPSAEEQVSETPKEICTNNLDDDLDGLIDCLDSDCNHKTCADGKICIDNLCAVSTVEFCDNNLDDDLDGLIDCEDFLDCPENSTCIDNGVCLSKVCTLIMRDLTITSIQITEENITDEISSLEQEMMNVMTSGRDVTEVQALLSKARDALYAGNLELAKQYIEQARIALEAVPSAKMSPLTIAVFIIIIISGVLLVLWHSGKTPSILRKLFKK